jgi:hypothetical protein
VCLVRHAAAAFPVADPHAARSGNRKTRPGSFREKSFRNRTGFCAPFRGDAFPGDGRRREMRER